MADSHTLGQNGEDIAVEFLKKKGYKILFRNWKWGKHEIDIIAVRDDIVAFVEVKTRLEEFMVDLGTVISRAKQQSIIFAAEGYIKRYNIDSISRFDLITIIGKGDNQKIEHIEEAFYPTLR
jgi:putative endonuclease